MNTTCIHCRESFDLPERLAGYDVTECPFCEKKIPIPKQRTQKPKQEPKHPLHTPVWIIAWYFIISAIASVISGIIALIIFLIIKEPIVIDMPEKDVKQFYKSLKSAGE